MWDGCDGCFTHAVLHWSEILLNGVLMTVTRVHWALSALRNVGCVGIDVCWTLSSLPDVWVLMCAGLCLPYLMCGY